MSNATVDLAQYLNGARDAYDYVQSDIRYDIASIHGSDHESLLRVLRRRLSDGVRDIADGMQARDTLQTSYGMGFTDACCRLLVLAKAQTPTIRYRVTYAGLSVYEFETVSDDVVREEFASFAGEFSEGKQDDGFLTLEALVVGDLFGMYFGGFRGELWRAIADVALCTCEPFFYDC